MQEIKVKVEQIESTKILVGFYSVSCTLRVAQVLNVFALILLAFFALYAVQAILLLHSVLLT